MLSMPRYQTPALWAGELKRLGWEQMLISRLEFHGRLRIDDVAHFTLRSIPTVRKHFRRLVELGKARFERNCGVITIIPPLRP